MRLANMLALSLLCLATLAGWTRAQNTCTTPRNAVGNCVAIQDCPSLLQVIQKQPISDENKLFLQKSQCGYKDRKPYVCCASVTSLDNSPKLSLLPLLSKCGTNPSNRIVGGERTKIDEFPWLVQVRYEDQRTKKLSFNCGGSLINERYVVTAAHCVRATNTIPDRYKPVAVRLGEWDTSTEQDCDQGDNPEDNDCVEQPVQDIEIETITPHSGFDPASTNVHNDIALLRLKTPAVLNFYVQPICLPRSEKLRTTSLDNLNLEVAGWGLTENRTKSTIKLKVNLKVVPLAQCTTIFPTRNIWNKQMCAGGVKGKDSCNGDSGGPLMKEVIDGKIPFWYLAGVVSYGHRNCGTENFPGVYTKVSEYFDWILENIMP